MAHCYDLENTDDVPARIAARGGRIPLLIKARENSLQIKPVTGLENCVTDEQITQALQVALPLWHPPSIPSLVHELKLWGKDCVFTKEQVGGEGRTGKLMVEALLSDAICAKNTVHLGEGNGGAYLIDSPYGIHPIQSGSYDAVEYRAETHYGKLTMLMALANVPLSTPVTSSSGRVGTLADILQDTIMNFHWGQELEFIGCSLAFWIPPEKSWTNKLGDTFTFDELMNKLLEKPLGEGCCGGCHAPYTVVTLLRIDKEHFPILSQETSKRANQWLKNVSAKLEINQQADGSWPRDWGSTGQNGGIYNDIVLDRITLLGHHLEWIALSPSENRPAEACIRKAINASITRITQLQSRPQKSFKTLFPCSHLALAFCLLKQQDATDYIGFLSTFSQNGGD